MVAIGVCDVADFFAALIRRYFLSSAAGALAWSRPAISQF
jgi:hypothetical protein